MYKPLSLHLPVQGGVSLCSSHWPQRPSNSQESPEQETTDQGQRRVASSSWARSKPVIQTPEQVKSDAPVPNTPSRALREAQPAKDETLVPGGEGGEEAGWLWSGSDNRKETEA